MTARVLLAGILIGVVLILVLGPTQNVSIEGPQPGTYQMAVAYDPGRARAIVISVNTRTGNYIAYQCPVTAITEISDVLPGPKK